MHVYRNAIHIASIRLAALLALALAAAQTIHANLERLKIEVGVDGSTG